MNAMWSYLRYSLELLFYFPLTYVAFLVGGWVPVLAVAGMTVTQVIADAWLPEDHHNPQVRRPWILDGMLLAHLPAGLLVLGLLAWYVTPGDLGGVGARLASWWPGLPLHRPEASWFDIVSGSTLAGFILSGNTIVAHELVHRRGSPLKLAFGRLLLGVNGDSQFEVAHVFGHHMNVATERDPATARRGETLYRFVLRSTCGQYAESLSLERKRLARGGHTFLGPRNVVLMGALGTVACGAVMFGLGAWPALAAYVFAIIYAKFMLETVNYIQHYGLVRVPGTRVEPRHSWDCMRAACTVAFYALSRHSHHHARPVNPFWNLHVTAALQGVSLRWGYLGAMLMAMVPPLWFRATSPMLLQWDRQCATPEEQSLVAAANRRSGLRALSIASAADPA